MLGTAAETSMTWQSMFWWLCRWNLLCLHHFRSMLTCNIGVATHSCQACLIKVLMISALHCDAVHTVIQTLLCTCTKQTSTSSG